MNVTRADFQDLPQLRQLWHLAFGDEGGFIDLFFSRGFSPERCLCIRRGAQIAAALYWFDCSFQGRNWAYLYGVATHPGFRNQGLCRILMDKTHALLESQGYAGSLLVPQTPFLRKMYEKMGYKTCSYVSEFACAAASSPAAIRRIEEAEFAVLRREHLPQGGVIQEKENIPFLSAQMELYSGDDFLLAAFREGDTLHGRELLGNRDAAPGILKALGFSRGVFRTPGQDLPFAMFLPLEAGAEVPGYFGLAFD